MYKERRVNNVGTVYYTCVGGSSPVEAPITMTDLGGATICGKRGGLSFLDAQRPQIDGSCPKNTVACSNTTSTANTICVQK